MGIASLFSGVGAVELGLRAHLREPLLLFCEVNEDARRVLRTQFPSVPCHGDVRTLEALPRGTTIVTAGSPCTDLSSLGRCEGIGGSASSLVEHVFRLVAGCDTVETVVLENVVNMMRLHRGEGVRLLTARLEALGFAWAYRVFDARAFGLPQARRRFVLVARRGDVPAPTWLLADRAWRSDDRRARRTEAAELDARGFAGFYINEGRRGSGFRVGAAPTIKCNGNSAEVRCGFQPHVLLLAEGTRADGARVVRLDIEDAERAQGLPSGWTAAAGSELRRFARVGNAVPVPFMELVGAGLAGKLAAPAALRAATPRAREWTCAAYGAPGAVGRVDVTDAPCEAALKLAPSRLTDDDAALVRLAHGKPVSANAARGFLLRARNGRSAMPEWALGAIRAHVRHFHGFHE
jgi:DNA (cytosine-5)-methyltransferase 1